jgi:superfamily I DNA/RNA helicase
MPYDPTPEQRAILAHGRQRHARVLAGPGTGKSATVVALVDQLLAENPAPRIKLITFTRAATAELAKKVSKVNCIPATGRTIRAVLTTVFLV